MKKLLQSNIGRIGRIIRGLIELILIGAAIAAWTWRWPAGVGGAFCLFVAVRGWCVARACGVKTRW